MFRLGTVEPQRLARMKQLGQEPPSLHSPLYYPDAEESSGDWGQTTVAAALELLKARQPNSRELTAPGICVFRCQLRISRGCSPIRLVALIMGGVFYGRRQALAIYGSAGAQEEWDAWRADAKKMAEQPGTVKRACRKSAEPPALVLMRDYFAVCLGLAMLLSTVLFGTFMFFVRGAFAQ